MTTARENGIRFVQKCVAGENAQDYDRICPDLSEVFPAVLGLK